MKLRSIMLSAVATLGIAAMVLAGAAPAQAAATGKISGVVKVGGTFVQNAEVTITPATGAPDDATVTTDGAGAFSFTGLTLRKYYLSVAETDDSQQVYTTVTLSSSKPSQTLKLAAKPWTMGTSVIAGAVTDGETSTPADGVTVVFFPLRSDVQSRVLTTNGAGSWFVGDLPAGRYSVQYSWDGYQGKDLSIDVPSGSYVDASATLHQPSASVSGTVTVDGTPVTEGQVGVTPDDSTDDLSDADTSIDENGVYSMQLAPGGYTISYAASAIAPLSQHVVLAADDDTTVDLDVTQPELGSISGKVTTASGTPIKGICVYAEINGQGDSAGDSPITGSSGTFTINDLPPGDYSLAYFDCSSRTTKYARVYEGGGVAWAADAVVAKRTHLDEGEQETGHVQKLVPGSSISGAVNVQAGDGIAALPTGHYPYDQLYVKVGGTWTAENIYQNHFGSWPTASYRIRDVAPGTYRLGIVDGTNTATPFPDGYYATAETVDTAKDIVVKSGTNRTGINVTWRAADPGDAPQVDSHYGATTQNLISAPSTAKQGQTITITAGKAHVGEYVSVWIHSASVMLRDWTRVKKDGTVTATIPATLASGVHQLVVQSVDDAAIGWRTITIAGGAYPGNLPGDVLVSDGAFPLHGSIANFPDGTTVSKYQWYRGSTAITGATRSTYTPTSSDFGHPVKLRVTFTVPGYAPTSRSSEALDYSLVPDDVVGVAADPDFRVGATASAREPNYTLRGDAVTPDFTFQWYRNDVAIEGADDEDYVIAPADAGKRLSVKVKAVLAGAVGRSVTSEDSPVVVKGTLVAGTTPSIVETTLDPPRPGVSIDATGLVPGATLTYQWYAGDTAISGATKPSYAPVTADSGKPIRVKITATRPGYTTLPITTDPVGPYTALTANPISTISDTTPKVGQVIYAPYPSTPGSGGGPGPDGGVYFQWYIGGKAISGLTDDSISVPSSAKDKTIKVRVTGYKEGYLPFVQYTASTSPVH